MSLESWCCLLTVDFYSEICRAVGCSIETEEEQVSIALNQSIIFDSTGTVQSVMTRDKEREEIREEEKEKEKEKYILQSCTSPNRYASTSTSASTSAFNLPHYHLKDPGFVPPVSSLWYKSKGDLVSSSILNPYLLRSLVNSEELESISSLFVAARRSVKDLQAILLLQLSRIALTDSSSSSSSTSSFSSSSSSPSPTSHHHHQRHHHHHQHQHHQIGSTRRYLLFRTYPLLYI